MKTKMTYDEMLHALEVWDQTIGCANCGKALWGEEWTADPTKFHADGCPLKGRRDVANDAPFDDRPGGVNVSDDDKARLNLQPLRDAYRYYCGVPTVKLGRRLEELADFHDEFGHGIGDISDTPAFLASRDRLAALQAFKDWVHKYLDDHGVPHHPPGSHGAEGCRIGDRMDWLMARVAELEAAARPFADRWQEFVKSFRAATGRDPDPGIEQNVYHHEPMALTPCRRVAALLEKPQ